MSIEVNNVSKYYGKQQALKDVSFKIGKGEVVGFLGPNGAGKSTMMKILTGYFPQSSGEVQVCGYDAIEDPIKVKQSVGYLPEHNPLYTEMYVKEYLNFVAGIYKLKDKKQKVLNMIESVGLRPEQHKKIGQLSKGFRQRVGLAQAMIHEPEVLILDEPTSGLDPNQLVEIRALIRRVGKERTVMLSTHIMQEVEAVCDRVIIINNGSIVADNEVSVLKASNDQQLVKVEFDGTADHKALLAIEGVDYVERNKNNNWILSGNTSTDIRSEVFQFAVNNGLKVLSLTQDEKGLEAVFKDLTNT